MTARRSASKDSAEFGFDAIGAAFTVQPAELAALLGLGPLAVAIYLRCLKPFCKGSGRVHSLSYYRLGQVLKHARSAVGGRPKADPTKQQIRDALSTLEAAGLIQRAAALNEQKGVLQIWVTAGVGGSAPETIRPGVRTGSKTAATRARSRS